MKSITIKALLITFALLSFYISVQARDTEPISPELIEFIIPIVRDTGDVVYITQASPGIIKNGSYRHPYITLEGAMDAAEGEDELIFLTGNVNIYNNSGPILLSKNVLITVEQDEIRRLADGESLLPLIGLPIIIN